MILGIFVLFFKVEFVLLFLEVFSILLELPYLNFYLLLPLPDLLDLFTLIPLEPLLGLFHSLREYHLLLCQGELLVFIWDSRHILCSQILRGSHHLRRLKYQVYKSIQLIVLFIYGLFNQ